LAIPSFSGNTDQFGRGNRIFYPSNFSTGLCIMTVRKTVMSAAASEMEVLDTMTHFCFILPE
jgi:hypothetical protein